MRIFDEFPSRSEAKKRHFESEFDFLNRSGRPTAHRVRALVEYWFSQYLEPQRKALISRFRSPIAEHHLSAFFELFLHALVQAKGHRILDVEPKLGHTTRSPDFLIETVTGERLYLEAVTIGRSTLEAAAEARLAQVLDAIDSTPSPHHTVSVFPETEPRRSVAVRSIQRPLEAWLAAQPRDETAVGAELVLGGDEFSLTVQVIRLRTPSEGGGTIDARFYPAEWVRDHLDIRDALKDKASRYGTLDHPYIVAFNHIDSYASTNSLVTALFGSEKIELVRGPDGRRHEQVWRQPNGVWQGRGGAQNRGMSAVFATERLTPWQFGFCEAKVIFNPDARMPLPAFDLGAADICIEGDRAVIGDAIRFSRAFGLSDQWPEEREDDDPEA